MSPTEQLPLFPDLAPEPTSHEEGPVCPLCGGSGRVPPHTPIPAAPARRTDPGTSHAAAERHADADVGRFSPRSVKAKLLREFARADAELTHYEAAANVAVPGEFHSRIETARRRVGELGDVGFIADTGKRRRNPGARAEAIVWRITFTGRIALERMDRTGWTR